MTNWSIKRSPSDPDKFYGYLMYHEWFYEWDSMNDAFDDICELYRTEKWWDYEGFGMYRGHPDWKWGDDRYPYIDWKAMLDTDQLKLLAELKTTNLNMH